MRRKYVLLSLTITFCATAAIIVSCTVPNLLGSPDPSPATPSGATVLISESFGGNLSKWDASYMVSRGVLYSQMRNSVAVVHSGTHSITSDSSANALACSPHEIVDSGIAHLEFWLYAQSLGEANFTVQFGENAPQASGGLGKSFGIGFGRNDSLKCTYFDFTDSSPYRDSSIAPILLGHWYKCTIEVDFNAKTISYFIDDQQVRTLTLLVENLYGIDRILAFRGVDARDPNDHPSGPKEYYLDDLVYCRK